MHIIFSSLDRRIRDDELDCQGLQPRKRLSKLVNLGEGLPSITILSIILRSASGQVCSLPSRCRACVVGRGGFKAADCCMGSCSPAIAIRGMPEATMIAAEPVDDPTGR